jgi:hypothetical protein
MKEHSNLGIAEQTFPQQLATIQGNIDWVEKYAAPMANIMSNPGDMCKF